MWIFVFMCSYTSLSVFKRGCWRSISNQHSVCTVPILRLILVFLQVTSSCLQEPLCCDNHIMEICWHSMIFSNDYFDSWLILYLTVQVIIQLDLFTTALVAVLITDTCIIIYIKIHGCVSAAKKAVWHTSVLYTGTANSPFSTPLISITTGPISIKFTYFMPSIYMTLHIKFEGNRCSSSWDMCSWKFPNAPFYKSDFEPTKHTLLMDQFLSNLAHL